MGSVPAPIVVSVRKSTICARFSQMSSLELSLSSVLCALKSLLFLLHFEHKLFFKTYRFYFCVIKNYVSGNFYFLGVTIIFFVVLTVSLSLFVYIHIWMYMYTERVCVYIYTQRERQRESQSCSLYQLGCNGAIMAHWSLHLPDSSSSHASVF